MNKNSARGKYALIAISVVFVGFLLLDGAVGLLGRDNMGVYTAMEQYRVHGWKDSDLMLSNSTVTGMPFWTSAVLEFKTNQPANLKTVRVHLRKHINLLGWYVVEYKEVPTTE